MVASIQKSILDLRFTFQLITMNDMLLFIAYDGQIEWLIY